MEATELRPIDELDGTTDLDSDRLHVIFKAADAIHGIPCDVVLEMATFERATPIPGSSPAVVGLLNLRGQVVGLLDLRIATNKPPLSSEVEHLQGELAQRKHEHIEWLNALERAVSEGTPFELGTDPHKCNFGRWYDSFETDNTMLAQLLQQFDVPHKRIHAIAQKALSLPRAAGLELIENTRDDDLATMIGLFDQTIEAVETVNRSIVLVIQKPGSQPLAILVDSVAAIQPLDKADPEDLPGYSALSDDQVLDGLALTEELGVIQLLNIDTLYASFSR